MVIVTFASYLPALRAGFVFDDAGTLVLYNPILKADNGLYRFWFTTEAPDYYPLTWSLLWSEWHCWGGHPAGYHVVNVLLHAVNAVLVWMVLRRLKVPGSWLAALVFAVHPVNVATVAWISEQKNTLSMLFYALAILLFLRFDEDDCWRWYGLSLATFVLALLSKTAIVMLPVVLLLCVWWRHGRVRRKDLLASAPFFLLSLVASLVTIWFQRYRALEGHSFRTANVAARLGTAGWVPWFYLGKVFLPLHLCVIYPPWHIEASDWLFYLPGMILVACLVVFWRARGNWGRPWFFALAYFVVVLFPVLGFFEQGFYRYSPVADHWQYPAIAAPIALVVAGAVSISRRRRPLGSASFRPFPPCLAFAVVLLLGTVTWTREGIYADAETLWRNAIMENPNAWIAQYNVGVTLLQTGRIKEAIPYYERALRIKPDYAQAYNNLGVAWTQTGRVSEAIDCLEQALRLKPDFAEAHYNLAIALLQAGRMREAIGHLEQALRLNPNYAWAHYKLGGVFEQTGRADDAIGHFEQALRLNPDFADAHCDLGIALAQAGRIPEAIEHLEQALRLKPDSPEVHCNLGIALALAGRTAEAIGHLEQALQLKPDFTQARNALTRLQPRP
ncbi:MAG: tetratricopeptide repeat protein [Verrucomicrobiia bacterium]